MNWTYVVDLYRRVGKPTLFLMHRKVVKNMSQIAKAINRATGISRSATRGARTKNLKTVMRRRSYNSRRRKSMGGSGG